MNNLYQNLRILVNLLMKILYNPCITFQDEIPSQEKIILVGNHKSNFDPLLLTMVTKRQIHFLAKEELFKGLLKYLMNNIESIPVKRDKEDFEVLKKATALLKEDKCLAIFPEGTLNKTSDLILPFKLGTIAIAKRSKADIIPFAITGNYRLIRNDLKLTIGKRIRTNDYTSLNLKEKVEYDVKKLILENR